MEKYSRTLGNILSQSLKKFVTPDSLPDERLYYNIAQTVLEPMLKDNYEFVNDLASQVQKSIDSKAKIQLNPQKAIYPVERINQVINAVSDVKAEWETIQRRLDSPVCTVTESFYDDYVKENAKFRNDSGLNCYITRTASASCCKWCSSLAGRYAYSDVPPDIYRRHDNCTCTVTFENGKTRQDVWSKKTWQVKETPKESYKPKKFSNEQAKAVQQENLQYKGIKNNLTSFQNNGNIKERPYEIKKSREKRLEIISRGIAEKYPVFSYDTEKNKFPSYSRNIPKEKGFYDVATHGADTFVDFFGENIDAYTLANIIRNRKDYLKGTNIRLLSCSTGNTENTGNCFAQLLANELGVCVKAPTKTIYVFINGKFTVGKRNDGEMKLFYPRK